MNEVVKFPQPPKGELPALLAGPIQYWAVIVDGRRIPYLSGEHLPDGGINLIVDGRFSGGPFYGETAHQAARLLAQALAVASGYPHFEASEKRLPFAPQFAVLGEVPTASESPEVPFG